MNQTQLDFRSRPRSQAGSQADRILEALTAQRGVWVSMPSLYHASGAYAVHSRISDLRRRGHNIEHANQWENGICKSFYRLL